MNKPHAASMVPLHIRTRPELPKFVALLPRWSGKCVGIGVIHNQSFVVACEYGAFIVRFDSNGSPPGWKVEQLLADEVPAEVRVPDMTASS